MAKPLENLLDPGERVLWRRPDQRLLEGGPRVLGATFFFTGFGLVIVGRIDLGVLIILFGIALAGCTVLELITWSVVRHISGRETVLTTRRLWQRRRDADGDNIIEVPLAGVTEIALQRDCDVALVKRDDGTKVLFGLRLSRTLAAALAGAAGLPPPRHVGRLASLWDYVKELGTPICFFLMVLLLPDGFVRDDAGLESADAVRLLLSLLACWFVAGLFGRHLLAVLGLVVLRPWVSAAEAWAWLDLGKQGAGQEILLGRLYAHLTLWRSPLYAWLVGLLWGAPTNGQNAGAHGHG